MIPRKLLALALLVLPLLLTGCLEQLSTTRLPGGAARNFFYFLSLGQPKEAAAYWAPDYIPADAEKQVADAIALLKPYEFQLGKSTAEANEVGDIAVVRGKVRKKGETEWSVDQDLMRAELIERGPGWRITSFEILCCETSAAATPTAVSR